jgi:hypothetical protein
MGGLSGQRGTACLYRVAHPPHSSSSAAWAQFFDDGTVFSSSSFSTVHDVLTPYSACHHFPRPHIRYASKVNIHPYTRPPPLTAFNETLAETKNVNRLVDFLLCLSKKIGF